MVRSLTGAAASKIAVKQGNEPVIIVEIDWATSTPLGRYADRDFSPAQGKIISLSGISSSIKIGGGRSVDSVSLVLDDTDESIKDIIDTKDIHKRPCKIYQGFHNALDYTNKFLIFSGEVISPLIWDESNRTVSLTIESTIETVEIGYSIEQSEADFVPKESIGKMWPIAFGNTVKVPAVKVIEQVRGKSLTKYSTISLDELKRLSDYCRQYADKKYDKDGADQIVANPAGLVDDEIYGRILNDWTNSYANLLQFKEFLLSQNNSLETELTDYIDKTVELRINEIYIDILQAAINITLEHIVKAGNELVDLTSALTVEQNKGSYANASVISYLLDAINSKGLTLTVLQQLNSNYATAVTDLSDDNAVLIADLEALTQTMNDATVTSLRIESDQPFEQDVPVEIMVNGAAFTGTFSGDVYTVASILPTYEQVLFSSDARPNSNTNEFWLADSSINLKNQYCLTTQGGIKRIVYVINQFGNRCFFQPVVWEEGSVINGHTSYTEVLFHDPSGTGGNKIIHTSYRILESWLAQLTQQNEPKFVTGEMQANVDWEINVGDTVYLKSDFKEVYVCNYLTTGVTVVEVMAYRSIKDKQQLTPVPSSYYTIDYTYSVQGQIVTAIIFDRPLEARIGESWEDQIYVSMNETDIGTNTVDQIEYIIESTRLSVDTTSFADTKTLIANYPSNFAILNKRDALELAEDIAWQARLALIIKEEVVYITYLSLASSTIRSIDESNIDLGSLKLLATDTEELVTKYIATWKPDYTEENKEIILRNNIPIYGTHEKTFDYFIYNIESLVLKSATFWMIRKSNTWKKVEFRAFLDQLDLEPLDIIAFTNKVKSALGVTVGAVRGYIESIDYDSDNFTLDIVVWTAVKAGMNQEYPLAWPADESGTLEYPTQYDLYAGGA